MKRILAINLGSTSTKISYFEDDKCIYAENLSHPIEDLQKFSDIREQYTYRKEKIEDFLSTKAIKVDELDCVITRGGHTEPTEGGCYRVNKLMLEQSASRKFGQHATDLGLMIADAFSQRGPIALTADPPVTDEFEVYARYSGMPEIERVSAFQALNHKAVAKKYAEDIGKKYEDLNLIVVHMGGGISIAAHKKGKMIDGNNALEGDGPFSTNRTGGLPVGALVDMCFSQKYSYEQIKRKINGEGGLVGYCGTNDVRTIEMQASENKKFREVLGAMCYQTAKDIGAQATVLKGKVDAIILTGGMANSQFITSEINERVSFIAPVKIYPGEFEMNALGKYAFNALKGEIAIKEFKGKKDK